MPINTKVWKLSGDSTEELSDRGFAFEAELEQVLFKNLRLMSNDWMIIGRQVYTGFGYIDLLAIDRNGDLVVLELKRAQTPREIIAQLLDYGSWVQNLSESDVANIFISFQKKFFPDVQPDSLDKKFSTYFGSTLPTALNSAHNLVVVAGAMDDSSERIVTYLSAYHSVNINFVLLRTFLDNESKFITKTWHVDPTVISEDLTSKTAKWNEEYYVSFGDGSARRWEDAIKYGFVCAGGGEWYSRTLAMLKTGDRIWVNIPKTGYVGTGIVSAEVVPVEQFEVELGGKKVSLKSLPLVASDMFHDLGSNGKGEFVVAVEWESVLPKSEAISEAGLFGNQNTVCQPTSPKWVHTVDRLKSLLKKSKLKAA